MIRRIIQIVLGIGIIYLGYLLYGSVKVPVKWEHEKEVRHKAIKEHLVDIRAAQAAHKAEYGHYAATFEELMTFLLRGKITKQRVHVIKFKGKEKTIVEKIPVNPVDSLYGKGYDVYQLPFVPYAKNKLKFYMKVHTNNGVEFIEVSDPEPFDSNDELSFGSLVEPTLKASWEK